jgi:probable rRNA maturation factor
MRHAWDVKRPVDSRSARVIEQIPTLERTPSIGTSLMQSEIEVEISNTQSHLRLEPGGLDRLVRRVLAAQGHSRASISIAVVDNSTIHTINQAHLGHDWPTDVITFPLADPDEPVLTGELVISAEMACTSARELGVEPGDELALYVVHGLLHLCGFDDHDDSARSRMRQREAELLSRAEGQPWTA